LPGARPRRTVVELDEAVVLLAEVRVLAAVVEVDLGASRLSLEAPHAAMVTIAVATTAPRLVGPSRTLDRTSRRPLAPGRPRPRP
jgi:hypothetical protein